MDRDEVKGMLMAMGIQWSDEKIENLFKVADADNSGTVDKKEFLSYSGLASNDPTSSACLLLLIKSGGTDSK